MERLEEAKRWFLQCLRDFKAAGIALETVIMSGPVFKLNKLLGRL